MPHEAFATGHQPACKRELPRVTADVYLQVVLLGKLFGAPVKGAPVDRSCRGRGHRRARALASFLARPQARHHQPRQWRQYSRWPPPPPCPSTCLRQLTGGCGRMSIPRLRCCRQRTPRSSLRRHRPQHQHRPLPRHGQLLSRRDEDGRQSGDSWACHCHRDAHHHHPGHALDRQDNRPPQHQLAARALTPRPQLLPTALLGKKTALQRQRQRAPSPRRRQTRPSSVPPCRPQR